LTVAAMLAEGLRRVRAARRTVALVFLVEAAAGLVFTLAVARTLTVLLGERPIFARGIAGDDGALLLVLAASRPPLVALLASGLALLAGWKLASFYLSAGLTGALAGQGFAHAAGARFGAFVRLSLWSLVPYAAAAMLGILGIVAADLRLEDLVAWDTLLGRPAAALLPAALAWAIVACAVDLGRALLVLEGGGAARALGFGLARAVRRPRLLGHYLLYLGAWLAVSALYLGVTAGNDFPGAAGGWLLFVLRQTTAGGRFLARAVATGGQVAALQGDVLEVREVAERREAAADLGRVEGAQAVEREALDRE
jgi:hypothetical protein